MRKNPLVTGEIYHICNRSTEGIPIFNQNFDIKYFLQILIRANTTGLTERDLKRAPLKESDGNPLVKVYAAVIMKNHFHLCVRQLVNNGITIWMQRSCIAFARSFNNTYERKGALFMGRFRAVPILQDKQLFHALVYIHANPLDYHKRLWREGKIKPWKDANQFLKKYQWSSLGLYEMGYFVGSEIQELVTPDGFIKKFINDYGGLEEGIRLWSERDFDENQNVLIE